MSRKRLLDAITLFQASRGVATNLLSLHRAQWDIYKKTSSLTNFAAWQADQFAYQAQKTGGKVLSTTASSLGNDSNRRSDSEQRSLGSKQRAEAGYNPQIGVTQENLQNTPGQTPPIDIASNNTPRNTTHAGRQEAQTASTSTRSSTNSPGDKQSEREVPLSPLKAQEIQRQAESQIPSETADPPPIVTAEIRSDEKEGIFVEQEQDVFFRPPPKSGPVLSALPRVKLPNNAGTIQNLDDHISAQDINVDVFHNATKNQIGNPSASGEVEVLPKETYAALFRSPKNARILKGAPKDSMPSTGTETAEHGDGQTSPESNFQAPSPRARGSLSEETAELERLGSDITSDLDNQTSLSGEEAQGLSQAQLSDTFEMRESRVPSSRFGRLWQYGGLATSMAFGAVGEGIRRATGSGSSEGSIVLGASNMERLVAKLSKMRGAALKLGQMMSFQGQKSTADGHSANHQKDSKMLPKPIHEVLRRVQDSADFMPSSQRDRVLTDNLGADWRGLFSTFADKPFAAASIGQVHKATLASSGKVVAVKVQYPGVASSINSDLSNLAILLTASKLLPKGLYLDKTIANARTELAWECDYVREAKMGKRFRELLSDEQSTFFVPSIIQEASGPQVLTAEFCEGTGVTRLLRSSQTQKDWIGTNILRLCLREITEFKFMQTDPNWTNFLYNSGTKRLELLDFGAAREYPDKFIVPYVKLLLAASRSDRDTVRELSVQLGYLTGHESRTMVNAHVDSVLTLAEPFMENAPETYDFQDQTITDRVRSLIPVMLRERLSPPPEETYSLHRKLSGAFLLCARLGSRVRCREMFKNAVDGVGIA